MTLKDSKLECFGEGRLLGRNSFSSKLVTGLNKLDGCIALGSKGFVETNTLANFDNS